MGELNILAYYGSEIIGSKTILGAFATIFIFMAIYNLFIGYKNIKQIILIAIYGIILTASLILLILAFNELNHRAWL